MRSGLRPGPHRRDTTPDAPVGPGYGRLDGTPEARRGHPAGLAEPPHARFVRGHRVRHPEPRPVRHAGDAVRESRHRLAAVHAGAPRHPRRRARLLVEAGGSIELWEESITAALRRADVTTMLVSDHPHLFETGGENYHVDFTGWDYVRGHEGDPWKTYADPSAYGAPTLTPDGRPLITNAADGGWFLRDQLGIADRSFGHRHYDDSRTWFRRRGGLPGPAHDGHGNQLAAPRVPGPRPLDAVRRRVRPARAVRHPGAVGVDVRRGTADAGRTGDRTARVASVPRRRRLAGLDLRTPGATDPQQLRRQVVDDRPSPRKAARRTRRAGPVGHHRGDRVHGPRPLPRRRAIDRGPRRRHRRRHLGQAGDPPIRTPRPHPADDPLARRSRQGSDPTRDRCAHDERRPQRHHCRHLRRPGGTSHPRPIDGAAADRRARVDPRLGHRRRLRQLGAGHRRTTQVHAGAGRRQHTAVDVVEPLVDHAGAQGPRGLHEVPEARPASNARLHARLRGPRDPTAVRGRRHRAVLGERITQCRSSPPLRPDRRSRRTREPPRRSIRGRHGRPAAAPRSSRSTHPTSNSPDSASAERSRWAPDEVACLFGPGPEGPCLLGSGPERQGAVRGSGRLGG